MAIDDLAQGISRRQFLNGGLAALATGLAAGIPFVPKADAEMRTENGYTFDYKEDGWEVPVLYKGPNPLQGTELADGVKYLGEKWKDKHPDIAGEESHFMGYRLPDGRIVTTVDLNGVIYVVQFNSFGREEGFGLINISPNHVQEDIFRYKYRGNTNIPMHKVKKQDTP